MARRAKRSILTIHRQIAKDNLRTLQANSRGGRYYKPSVSDLVRPFRTEDAEPFLFKKK